MRTLEYQPKSPSRRKWVTATILISIGVCGTALAAVSWVFLFPKPQASVLIPAPIPGPSKPRPTWGSYWLMHEAIVDKFIHSEGFGNARMWEDVCWTYHSTVEVNGKIYGVGPVQLISLNDGDEPFVYCGEEGRSPFKKELKNAKQYKHVALDEWQAAALKELQAGKDVVQEGSGKDLRLLGAVRATTSCLHCHDVNVGALMGAFNYPLIDSSFEGE